MCEGQAQRSGDDRGAEAIGSGAQGGRCGTRDGSQRNTLSTPGKRSTADWKLTKRRRLRQLEDENRRLKKLVADLSLDKDMLKAVICKKRTGARRLRGRSELAAGALPGQRSDGFAG